MERYMECPYCRSLSFLGEWLTPKELQSMESKPCDNCKKEVSTAFLVQPKEKKRGKKNAFLIL
jgi:DNA-directed RNA polymerase subunit RPC12/RpoP